MLFCIVRAIGLCMHASRLALAEQMLSSQVMVCQSWYYVQNIQPASPADVCAFLRANIIIGFEVANRYTILDEHGDTVALLAEEEGYAGRAIGRQLLRTRRPFTATVFSPTGGVHLP